MCVYRVCVCVYRACVRDVFVALVDVVPLTPQAG